MTLWWVLAGLAAILLCFLAWLAWRWLAGSWEVLDEEQLEAKLAQHSDQHQKIGRWFGIRRWFEPKPRQLFYRRDKLGRFRKIKRW